VSQEPSKERQTLPGHGEPGPRTAEKSCPEPVRDYIHPRFIATANPQRREHHALAFGTLCSFQGTTRAPPEPHATGNTPTTQALGPTRRKPDGLPRSVNDLSPTRPPMIAHCGAPVNPSRSDVRALRAVRVAETRRSPEGRATVAARLDRVNRRARPFPGRPGRGQGEPPARPRAHDRARRETRRACLPAGSAAPASQHGLKTHDSRPGGAAVEVESSAATYSPTRLPVQYHRRWRA
jgi:hypothetical protein